MDQHLRAKRTYYRLTTVFAKVFRYLPDIRSQMFFTRQDKILPDWIKRVNLVQNKNQTNVHVCCQLYLLYFKYSSNGKGGSSLEFWIFGSKKASFTFENRLKIILWWSDSYMKTISRSGNFYYTPQTSPVYQCSTYCSVKEGWQLASTPRNSDFFSPSVNCIQILSRYRAQSRQ